MRVPTLEEMYELFNTYGLTAIINDGEIIDLSVEINKGGDNND